MSSKLEQAKKNLHMNKLKIMLEEKQLKVLERLEDIERIETDIKELVGNIEKVKESMNE